MKKFIKYPLMGLGILIVLAVVFIILALCGVFRHENRFVCGTYFVNQQQEEKETSIPDSENTGTDEWIEEHDSVSGVHNSFLHRFLSSHNDGYYKLFNSKGSQKFHYNGR